MAALSPLARRNDGGATYLSFSLKSANMLDIVEE
jgi:hypothetical protein